MEPEISVFLLEFKKAFLSKLPWWPSVKNLPASAGNRGLIPSPGTKIPHAVEQLSLRATATEGHTTHLQVHVPTERPHTMQRRSCMLQLRPDTAK